MSLRSAHAGGEEEHERLRGENETMYKIIAQCYVKFTGLQMQSPPSALVCVELDDQE